MNSDPDSIAKVTAGSIVQIVHGNGHQELDGRLLIVSETWPWGVVGTVDAYEGRRLPWDQIETTGGKVVWDANGDRLVPPETRKHHP